MSKFNFSPIPPIIDQQKQFELISTKNDQVMTNLIFITNPEQAHIQTLCFKEILPYE